jgi:hypothetical protein
MAEAMKKAIEAGRTAFLRADAQGCPLCVGVFTGGRVVFLKRDML